MSQSQQQTQDSDTQEEKIKMSVNLPYDSGISEKLWIILRTHKIQSSFYIEKALHILLC